MTRPVGRNRCAILRPAREQWQSDQRCQSHNRLKNNDLGIGAHPSNKGTHPLLPGGSVPRLRLRAFDPAGKAAAAREMDVQVTRRVQLEIAPDQRFGDAAIDDIGVDHFIRGVIGAYRERPARQVGSSSPVNSAAPGWPRRTKIGPDAR